MIVFIVNRAVICVAIISIGIAVKKTFLIMIFDSFIMIWSIVNDYIFYFLKQDDNDTEYLLVIETWKYSSDYVPLVIIIDIDNEPSNGIMNQAISEEEKKINAG